jgi:hypothetical protein
VSEVSAKLSGKKNQSLSRRCAHPYEVQYCAFTIFSVSVLTRQRTAYFFMSPAMCAGQIKPELEISGNSLSAMHDWRMAPVFRTDDHVVIHLTIS